MKIDDIVVQHEEDWTHIQDQLTEHQALIKFFLALVGYLSKNKITTTQVPLEKKEDQMTKPMATLNVFLPPLMEHWDSISSADFI